MNVKCCTTKAPAPLLYVTNIYYVQSCAMDCGRLNHGVRAPRVRSRKLPCGWRWVPWTTAVLHGLAPVSIYVGERRFVLAVIQRSFDSFYSTDFNYAEVIITFWNICLFIMLERSNITIYETRCSHLRASKYMKPPKDRQLLWRIGVAGLHMSVAYT